MHACMRVKQHSKMVKMKFYIYALPYWRIIKRLLAFKHWLQRMVLYPDVKRTVHMLIIAHCISFVRRFFVYKRTVHALLWE